MDASPGTKGGGRPGQMLHALARRARGFLRFPTAPKAHDPEAMRAHRWKVARHALGCVAIAVVTGTSVLMLLGAWLVGARPSWWTTGDLKGPGATALAEGLEHTLLETASQVRPTAAGFVASAPDEWRSDDWAISITSEQATAWLNVRFPAWIVNRAGAGAWPSEVTSIVASFEDGAVRLGGELAWEQTRRYVSADLLVGIREDGSLWATADWLRVGRLPVPAAWILKRASEADGQPRPGVNGELADVGDAIRALAGEAAVAVAPALSLGDGRRVRVLSIKPEDGVLRITCRTEAGPRR